jgi:hypothetical protein
MTQQPTRDKRCASLHPWHHRMRHQILPGSRTITTTLNISPPPAVSAFLRPSHAGPTTRSQLRARTAHMINCVIATELMPSAVNPAFAPPAAIGYAFVAYQLAIENHVAHHFIRAVINDKIGNMLEYRHLVKNKSTRALWETSFANKIGRLFQGIRHLKGTNRLLHLTDTGPIGQTTHVQTHLLQFFPTERRTTLHTPHSWW